MKMNMNKTSELILRFILLVCTDNPIRDNYLKFSYTVGSMRAMPEPYLLP
jgi:hypothetical protein